MGYELAAHAHASAVSAAVATFNAGKDKHPIRALATVSPRSLQKFVMNRMDVVLLAAPASLILALQTLDRCIA